MTLDVNIHAHLFLTITKKDSSGLGLVPEVLFLHDCLGDFLSFVTFSFWCLFYESNNDHVNHDKDIVCPEIEYIFTTKTT